MDEFEQFEEDYDCIGCESHDSEINKSLSVAAEQEIPND
jgi:hypothetical protein